MYRDGQIFRQLPTLKKNAETRETIFQKIYFLRGVAPPPPKGPGGGARGVENLKWQHRASGGSFKRYFRDESKTLLIEGAAIIFGGKF